MKHEPLSSTRHSAVTLSEEDGRSIIGHHVDMEPHIKAVRQIRDMHATATKQSNTGEWQHVGRVPMEVIHGWLKANKFTMHQWAINEGGIKGVQYPDSKSGVKDKFMAYFLSREYSKLHNTHVTTRKKSSMVPGSMVRNAIDLTGIGT
jgi:hypothetical protein